MDHLLRLFLGRFIHSGSITFTTAAGAKFTCGDGTGTHVAARFLTRQAETRMLLNPELAFGEAYMDGRMIVEEGTLTDVLEILISNLGLHGLPQGVRFGRGIRRWFRQIEQFNPAPRARKNVAHHYDLSGELYDLFLDSDRQYSCAYFNEPKMTLEQAQAAKKRHIMAKLNFDRPGLSVLDIGSGWGGLGLELAREAGANVLGVTLSTEQLAMSNRRAAEAGLAERCRFEFRDYRDVEGPFRPHRFGRHVRTCRRRLTTTNLSGRCAICSRPTASCCCTRSAAPMDRAPRIPGSPNIFSRAAISPALTRSHGIHRALRTLSHGRGSPAAALCRDAEGMASALHEAARRSAAASMTSAFPGCGSSTLRPPK